MPEPTKQELRKQRYSRRVVHLARLMINEVPTAMTLNYVGLVVTEARLVHGPENVAEALEDLDTVPFIDTDTLILPWGAHHAKQLAMLLDGNIEGAMLDHLKWIVKVAYVSYGRADTNQAIVACQRRLEDRLEGVCIDSDCEEPSEPGEPYCRAHLAEIETLVRQLNLDD